MGIVGDTIDRWASQPSGFVWVEGRRPPWVPVQEMAQKYSFDDKRNNPKTFGKWEASAARFMDAVHAHGRWCLDPGEEQMLDDAVEAKQAFRDSLPWETKQRRRKRA